MASARLDEMQLALDVQRDEPDHNDKAQRAAHVRLTRPREVMEREQEPAFDVAGFLELLGDSLQERLHDHKARTGVLSARIHVRDGEPWAVYVRFDNAEERAA